MLVHADDGSFGVASGAPLPDAELLSGLLVGVDPRRTEVVRSICETVDFHGGGRGPSRSRSGIWSGARSASRSGGCWADDRTRCVAYASTGERLAAEERVARVKTWVADGIRAVKLRFHHQDWREDVEVVEAVRDAVGSGIEILVDANQGWRMPGDVRTPWDVATATACARALERSTSTGWRSRSRRPTSTATRRSADGRPCAWPRARWCETLHEARDLILRGGVDVVQPDVMLAGGIGGCRRIAAVADAAGRAFSPHTWTNGVGMIANLHLAMAVSTVPFIEVPFDPPAWGPDRRDWMLPQPIPIAVDGTIRPPEGPGLGVTLDLDALEPHRVG